MALLRNRTIAFLALLTSPTHGWSPLLLLPSHTLPTTITSSSTTPPRIPTALHLSKRRTRPQDEILASLTSPPTFPYGVDPSSLPPGPPSSDPLTPLIHTIVRAADMRKASNIVALRVTSCTSLTEFVVIVSGTSRPQNQAIAAAIVKDVEGTFVDEITGVGKRCLGKGVPEGTADSGWILIDYGDVMVHVMTPKSRLFYDLEGQWKQRGGEYMDLSGVLIDESGGVGPLSSSSTMDDVDIDDDDNDFDDDDEEAENKTSNIRKPTMKELLDVEKEIDPFWS